MKILADVIKCLAVVIVILVACIEAFFVSTQLPTDKQVAQKFEAQKETLIKLTEMLSHESPTIVGVTEDKVMLNDTSNWVSPQQAGISVEHFSEYRTLLHKAGIKSMWNDAGATYFYLTGAGFASFGWRLCFAYTKTSPSPIVSSIDLLRVNRSVNREAVYRSLGDNWYMRLIY